MAIALLRPSSPLYEVRLDIASRGVAVAIALLLLFQAGIVVCVGRVIGASLAPFDEYSVSTGGPWGYDNDQYAHVADALLAGRLTLDLPVAESLRGLPNPYDTAARSETLSAAGEYFYMDYAYYQGSYYSYFGVLPALISYAPFKLLTGRNLPNAPVALAYGITLSCAIAAAFYRLYRRFFNEANLGAYLTVELAAFFGCGIVYLTCLPTLYSVPILLGLTLVHAAIWCWLGAADGLHTRGSLSKPYLLAGGICGGLTILCRPLYVLVALVAVGLFWREVFRDRLFFSRKGLGNTLCVMVPFVAVGCIAMAYNYARFGSPLDFGAAYNLTGEDMTARHFVLARVPACLFEYLFQPLTVTTAFPYVHLTTMEADFQGIWFFEPYVGGFFALSPVALFAFGAFRKKDAALDDACRPLALVCWVIAMVIAVADFTVASITQRYHSDFAWALLICAALVIWSRWQRPETPAAYKSVVVGLLFLGAFLVGLAEFAPGTYVDMAHGCPTLYYFVKYQLFGLLL